MPIFSADFQLILVLVEEEVFFGGVVGPDVFDAFVGFAFVFDFLKVFDYFHWRSATHGIVYQLFLGCGPGCVFELGREFESPVHIGMCLIIYYLWFGMRMLGLRCAKLGCFFLISAGFFPRIFRGDCYKCLSREKERTGSR